MGIDLSEREAGQTVGNPVHRSGTPASVATRPGRHNTPPGRRRTPRSLARSLLGAAEEEAPVDEERRPGDVVRVVGGEEGGRAADVFGGPQASPGELRPGLGDEVGAERLVLARRVDPARL